MNANKEIITKIIKDLGISPDLRGYHYIRYAIEILLTDKSFIGATMLLYQTVAEEFNTTTAAVERCTRHAIEVGWNRTPDQEFITKLFGNTLNTAKEYPTNSEFITTIADYILIHQEN
jgi:two-component system response regulator (stage 0 sporulation protein A)